MKKMIASLMVLGAVAAQPAFAGEKDVLDGYKKSGEVENCVSLNSIRTTKVLDGSHILFKMNGGKTYVNTLPRECSSLEFHKAFSYKVYGSKLCNVDTISVLTGGSVPGPTCGLGKFEEIVKADTPSEEDGASE